MYAEGSRRHTFVRDNNGDVWEWTFWYILNWYSLIQLPIMGLLAGIVIAIWTEKSNKAHKTNRPASL